jgi:hypothetical protein
VFRLLGSRFPVRVQVRFLVPGSWFGVRGSTDATLRLGADSQDPNTNLNLNLNPNMNPNLNTNEEHST